jgi:pimeloyl-ACP methyl ester carboxylesterase
MPTVVFCHGLESSPHGSKFQALRGAGFDVVSPDFQGQNLAARVATLEPVLRATPDVVLVGSSYGGITALCGAIRHVEAGGLVRGLVLCAPALGRFEAPADSMRLYPPAPTILIHGRADDVVPARVSEEFAAAHPSVQLVLVDDEHRLKQSIAVIVAATRSFVDGTPFVHAQ